MDSSQPKSVKIYTRGVSSIGGAGGYGVVLTCGDHRKELSGGCAKASNNRMDILAVLVGLRALKSRCTVTVITNNSYVADAIAKGWVYLWRASGWVNSEGKGTPHVDLWEELIELCSRHQVSFVWQRYDPSNKDYACADMLAHKAARELGSSLERNCPAEYQLVSDKLEEPPKQDKNLADLQAKSASGRKSVPVEAMPPLSQVPLDRFSKCWACNGAGFIGKQRCSACKGTGAEAPPARDEIERFGRATSESPPGVIYPDNPYGNRRWK